jgi:hypothetical protein
LIVQGGERAEEILKGEEGGRRGEEGRDAELKWKI